MRDFAERVELSDGAYLEAYLPENPRENPGDAVLICPGGGYVWLSEDREGYLVAGAYQKRGIRAFVLYYSVGEGAKFPRPLRQATEAILHVRRNATRYGVKDGRVFTVGFSAGGHLAASLGTLWHLPELADVGNMTPGENKPTGMILCYPVITAMEYAHKDSFYHILGTETPTEEELRRYSLELQADARTAPAFLAHTADDGAVPVENTLLFSEALSRAHVPFEVHIYPHAMHGFALGTAETAMDIPEFDNPAIAQWVDHSILFMGAIK